MPGGSITTVAASAVLETWVTAGSELIVLEASIEGTGEMPEGVLAATIAELNVGDLLALIQQQTGRSTGSGQNPTQQHQQGGRADDPMRRDRDRDQDRSGRMTEEQRRQGGMPGRQNEDEIDVTDPASGDDRRDRAGQQQQRQQQTGKGYGSQGTDRPRE